jgi:hypothetical protein
MSLEVNSNREDRLSCIRYGRVTTTVVVHRENGGLKWRVEVIETQVRRIRGHYVIKSIVRFYE